ncbi:MAG: MBL fold metallo-hydrolase [Akkermansiaceae bacterium]|nr:MBL fold metallo-hydrolase [Akkermansiaceae bacterium]
MKFAVLGSGSQGNAAVVDCAGARLLIDAGLSAKQLTLRLEAVGIPPDSLHGILLTHEHGDHVRGLRVFLKQHPVPVYATRDTARIVREGGVEHRHWKVFESGRTFAIGAAEIDPFATQHDAVDPVGFVVRHTGKSLGLLSDAGHVTRSITEKLHKLDGLFVEANYDEDLLEADVKRPWSIKQRISSRHGHLSNTQVMDLVSAIIHPELSHVVLGHLSSDCNCPDLALRLLRNCLKSCGTIGVAVHCASQEKPTGWFAL